jgi:hypothetical protein
MAQVAKALVSALPSAAQRKTRTGDAWRSAMAPKSKGVTSAATADVANA